MARIGRPGGDGRVHQLIQHGTCAFGLESMDVASHTVEFRNVGISNMVTNAIRNYGKDGEAGGSGHNHVVFTEVGQRKMS